MKLSQYLKYGGIFLGVLGGLKILYAELALVLAHPVALIIIIIGAVVWCAGAWEARHEAQVAQASAPKVTVTTSTGV